MTIEFYSGKYLKQWPNWSGAIPQIGDTVLLHSEYSKKDYAYKVVGRTISDTNPDKVIINLEWIDR